MDMSDPEAVVSPGGVVRFTLAIDRMDAKLNQSRHFQGFDINCGVRLIRTNLFEKDIVDIKEILIDALYNTIPVGVGTRGNVNMSKDSLDEALEMGMDWSVREGYAWDKDKEHCEECV